MRHIGILNKNTHEKYVIYYDNKTYTIEIKPVQSLAGDFIIDIPKSITKVNTLLFEICLVVRSYIIDQYRRSDGHCIEASEYMEKILRFKGYTTSRGGIVFGEMRIMVQIDLMMNIHSWNWEANTIWT